MIITNKADIVTRQILFNPVLQQSVGCIIPQAIGVMVGGVRTARAGTPLMVSLDDRTTNAALATGDVALNAVLVHDVDVTHGSGNGTACIFGFINLARVDEAVLPLIATAQGNEDASPLIKFLTAE